ncbi:MAG: cytidylate kinase-like family protein [Eubacteriales bacterium]|nr:cytidylate kinase-like family protein [Eubacteriales bacterium]
MSKQLIISVSREFGSGGHCIAEMLAKKFQLPLLDKNILWEIAMERELDHRHLEKYDETPKSQLFTRTVKGFSSSPEENIANLQFQYLKKKAENGDSFVVVGRCAEAVLKQYPAMVSIFVLAPLEDKIDRIMEKEHLNQEEAKQYIQKQNRKRKNYHNYYSDVKWGDSRNYDITINSSRLGLKETADLLEIYIKKRRDVGENS